MTDILRFNGDSGRRPQAEARYVYSVLATMLEHELTPEEHGGIEFDADRRRLKRVVHDVIIVLRKRASSGIA